MAGNGVRFPNKFLIFGVLFMLTGGILLLFTAGYLPRFTMLWPVIPLLAGMYFLYLAFARNGPESYVFVGMLLGLGGLFMLLRNTLISNVALERLWPVFMSIVGLSLVAYGIQRGRSHALGLVLPGAAFFLLSLVFLVFSLNLVDEDFVDFVVVWWPSLLLIIGIAFIVSHIVRRVSGDEEEENFLE